MLMLVDGLLLLLPARKDFGTGRTACVVSALVSCSSDEGNLAAEQNMEEELLVDLGTFHCTWLAVHESASGTY